MLFIIILIFIILLSTIYLKRTDKNLKKIAIAYTVFMCIIFIISMCNLYGLYEVSDYTYILLLLSVISFIVTFVFIGAKIVKQENVTKIDFDKIIKSKTIIVIVLINLLLIIAYKIKYDNIVANLPIYQIRLARFNKLFNGAFETLFFNYIIAGIVSISSILFSTLLVNKKIKNILFWLLGANIIVYSLIGYGRMLIFNVAIYLVINILLKENLKEMLKLKKLIQIGIFFIIIIVLFIGMMYPRISNKNLSFGENLKIIIEDLTQQGVEYFVGGIRLLDNFIENGFDCIDGYTYGRATLAGIEEIVLYPIKGIGIEIDSFNNIIASTTQESIPIGENTPYFNAFYTCVMNFYLDFGIIGVFVYPMLHAILIALVLNNYNRKKNLASLILLDYVVLNLFFSIIRWNYQAGSTMFVFIILIVCNVLENIKLKMRIKKGGKIENENTLDC